jgi:hypothetical protein
VNANTVKWVVVKYDNDDTEIFKIDASGVTIYQEPTTTSYQVQGGPTLAAGTLGDTSLIEITSAIDAPTYTVGFEVNGIIYGGCADLYTPGWDLKEGTMHIDTECTYLTLKPKKSGTITFIVDRKLEDGVWYDEELYVKGDDDSYSLAKFDLDESAYVKNDQYRMLLTAHLDEGETYILTATGKIWLAFYGYTFTVDTADNAEADS